MKYWAPKDDTSMPATNIKSDYNLKFLWDYYIIDISEKYSDFVYTYKVIVISQFWQDLFSTVFATAKNYFWSKGTTKLEVKLTYFENVILPIDLT